MIEQFSTAQLSRKTKQEIINLYSAMSKEVKKAQTGAKTGGNGKIDQLETLIKNSEGKIDALETSYVKAIKEKDKKINELNTSMTELSKKAAGNGDVRDALEKAQKQIDKLVDDKNSSLNEIAKLRAENGKLKDEIIEELMRLEEDIKKKEEEYHRVQGKVTEMSREYDRIMSEKNKLNDEFNTMKLDYQKKMLELQDERKRLKEEHDRKERLIEELKRRINRLEEKEKRYDALNQDYQKLAAEHDELKTVIKHEIDLLEKDVENKENIFAQANQMIREIEESKNRLIDEFKERIKTLDAANTELSAQVKTFKEQAEQYRVLYEALRNSFTNRLPRFFSFRVKRYLGQYPILIRLFATHLASSGVKNLLR